MAFCAVGVFRGALIDTAFKVEVSKTRGLFSGLKRRVFRVVVWDGGGGRFRGVGRRDYVFGLKRRVFRVVVWDGGGVRFRGVGEIAKNKIHIC